MQIAVYTDTKNQLISLYEPGRFCLYQGSGRDWTRIQEIAFAVGESTSLGDVKRRLASAVAQFDSCDVLLSGSVKGFLYSYLQEFGFRIWKSEGSLTEQLAGVEQREIDRAEQQRLAPKTCAAAAGCASGGCGGGRARKVSAEPTSLVAGSAAVVPEDLGGGHFRIDLAAALGGDTKLNSRQILMPVLEEANFEELEIVCDHLPRWFEPKLRELNMIADCVPLEAGHGVKATVSHIRSCG